MVYQTLFLSPSTQTPPAKTDAPAVTAAPAKPGAPAPTASAPAPATPPAPAAPVRGAGDSRARREHREPALSRHRREPRRRDPRVGTELSRAEAHGGPRRARALGTHGRARGRARPGRPLHAVGGQDRSRQGRAARRAASSPVRTGSGSGSPRPGASARTTTPSSRPDPRREPPHRRAGRRAGAELDGSRGMAEGSCGGIPRAASNSRRGPARRGAASRRPAEANRRRVVDGSWIALESEWYLTAFIPKSPGWKLVESPVNGAAHRRGARHAAGTRSRARRGKGRVLLYVGPKEYDRLKAFGVGLEKSIYFGGFPLPQSYGGLPMEWVTVPLLWLLHAVLRVQRATTASRSSCSR